MQTYKVHDSAAGTLIGYLKAKGIIQQGDVIVLNGTHYEVDYTKTVAMSVQLSDGSEVIPGTPFYVEGEDTKVLGVSLAPNPSN